MGIVDILHILYVIVVGYVSAFIEVFVPPKRKSIKDENVLITGGGHGIGRELALEISKLGATVVVWDINKDGCENTVADVKKNGGRAFAYHCDITNTTQIRTNASKVRKDVGEIGILINNAGILKAAPLMDLDEDGIRRTFEVNTLAHFWMIREFLPYMMSHNRGHILNVCSMCSLSGTGNLIDYSASKYAALGFSESLIDELDNQGLTGIKVSSLCPMVVDTGLLKTARGNNICDLLTANEVALAGIDGMLRNYEVITVPSYFLYAIKFANFFPRKTAQFMRKLGNFKVESQLKKKE